MGQSDDKVGARQGEHIPAPEPWGITEYCVVGPLHLQVEPCEEEAWWSPVRRRPGIPLLAEQLLRFHP